MTKQEQSVGENSEGIQGGRDVIIHNSGMTPAQMTEIMEGMAKQIAIFQAQAYQIVEIRLKSFHEDILKTFAQPGKGNPEAFCDPDFQYLLNDAQTAYARSGDETVKDTLVDLIARRSHETERNRIAITLDFAVQKNCITDI